MKIMFVINSLNVGGAEQMLAKIAKNIAFADDDITVVTLIGNGILAEEFVGENHRVISLGLFAKSDVVEICKACWNHAKTSA